MRNETEAMLFHRARKAGLEAGQKANCEMLTVTDGRRVYEPFEICGFAWVNVKPGNCRFANYLKKHGHGRRDSYAGGVTIWIGEHGQSYDRKMAHASAMASVLQQAGIKAYASGRLD